MSSTSSDDSSCDDASVRFRSRMRPAIRMGTLREDALFSHSDPESSEMSCDTVIYVGANGRALSDRELTDNEGPPVFRTRAPLRNSEGEEDSGDKPLSRLPPKSPARALNSSQLPRKQLPSKIKTNLHSAKPEEDSAKNTGPEHWVDGPGGLPAPGEHWVDGPATAPSASTSTTIKDSEQWVDGPSAFRIESPVVCAEPSPRNSHRLQKIWSERQKQQQQQENNNNNSSTSKQQSAETRTPKANRKELAFQKLKSRTNSEPVKSKIPQVSNSVVNGDETVEEVTANSSTSLSVNPDSRPVSCHSEEVDTRMDPVVSLDLAGPGQDQSVPYPVNTFVHDWVVRHSQPVDGKPDERPKRSRKPQHSERSRLPRHSSPKQVSQDDLAALPQKTHSADHVTTSAQSSPRLQRLRKHGLPAQACPTDRTASWVMSVQEETTDKQLPDGLTTDQLPTTVDTVTPTSPSEAVGSESPECDQVIPGSPPPDYDSCVDDRSVGQLDDMVDTQTESCQDPPPPPVEKPAVSSSSLDVTNLLMNNRQSIYELQMDEQLEAGGDGSHKTSFGSDALSGCSSYENITAKADTVVEEADEGILVVEITQESFQLSPLTLHADNESGIASGGSGGHLSPPSSSDDSEKSPGAKRLTRPSSLRRPDGASNPNLTEICEMDTIKEESLKSERSFEVHVSPPCERDPAADGQSPESESTTTPTTTSPQVDKQPPKSFLPSPSKPPVSKSSSRSKGEKPAVPPRGTKLTSPPASAGSSPTKSISSSPIRNIFSRNKDKSSKLPKAPSSSSSSSSSSSPSQEKSSTFARSSSAKASSKSSSKLPMASTSKPRSLSSPTKSSSGIKEPTKSRSKSPSPSKRDSRLARFGSKSSWSQRNTDSDSGNDSGIVKNDKKKLASPYSKLTRPRLSTASSSGHGSDNSSSVSQVGKLQRAALNKTETSSGYESMVRDEEENSTSDSGGERGARTEKLGERRSRSAPARGSPTVAESPSPRRKPPTSPPARHHDDSALLTAPWVDTRKCQGLDDREPLEIEKYSGDDLEKNARRRRETEFRALEKRRQRISELLSQQENLKLEMMEAKSMLMIDKSTWSFDLHVAQHMDRDDPGYLEALEKETSILEKRVDACKSRIMMVTCFDNSMS